MTGATQSHATAHSGPSEEKYVDLLHKLFDPDTLSFLCSKDIAITLVGADLLNLDEAIRAKRKSNIFMLVTTPDKEGKSIYSSYVWVVEDDHLIDWRRDQPKTAATDDLKRLSQWMLVEPYDIRRAMELCERATDAMPEWVTSHQSDAGQSDAHPANPFVTMRHYIAGRGKHEGSVIDMGQFSNCLTSVDTNGLCLPYATIVDGKMTVGTASRVTTRVKQILGVYADGSCGAGDEDEKTHWENHVIKVDGETVFLVPRAGFSWGGDST
jgi:hypothetical protein